MKQKTQKINVEKMAVTAIMLAAAELLSILKLVELPYGGSITLAALLPIVILSYRYGTLWGVTAGFIHGLIQLVLGIKVLTYVTGWQSVAAVVILDYLLAFAVVGLSGLARKMTSSQPAAFLIGSFIGCVFRYVCHVISGATVWAGLSIPTEAALAYSFVYNATYLLPEMLILMVVGFYLSTTLDFGSERLRAVKNRNLKPVHRILNVLIGGVIAAAVVFDVAMIFSKLQDAESGEFNFANIVTVDWKWVILISAIAVAVAVVLLVFRLSIRKKEEA